MKMRNMKMAFSILLMLLGGVAFAQQKVEKPGVKSRSSFAIVIDADTYAYAKAEVDAYKAVVERDGLGTYVLVDNWSDPKQIRDLLHKLYQQQEHKLEGVVLVGTVPIPMIRDAQFLTSAFKMNQQIRWDKSSVPSDRFYDDFGLQFEFLKQDTAKGREHYFYYSLKPESKQYITMDIYSARIKPPVEEGEDPKPKVKEYLQKVVRLRNEDNVLNDMVVTVGHGYNSNSFNSITGEALSLKSQLPKLFKPGNSIKFLNFRNADFIKFNLLSEIKRPGIDFAFMTGHGTPTLQLFNGYPYVSAPQPSMQNVARYIRSKMRSAKESGRDLEEVKANFQSSLGLNDKWFEDAFVEESIVADSIFNANLDMQIQDIKDANIQARMVYLNSCLTGSFHLDEYIAGYYPFSKNENIVAIANSIGVLQDLWSTELLGILQHGVRVGHWLKHVAYLETHILGDPTFHFASARSNELNQALVEEAKKAAYWKGLLKENDADLQALALVQLARILPQNEMSPLLRDAYFDSAFESVRMEAFQLLRNYEDQNYFDVLHAAKGDSYEYIRRRAAYDLADFGGDDFVKDQIEFYVSDPHSERIAYRTRWNLQFMNPKLAHHYVDELIANNSRLVHGETLAEQLHKEIDQHAERTAAIETLVKDKTKTDKERLREINSMRLYRRHALIPALIDIAIDENESAEIRKTVLEVMGWYPISVHRENIVKACDIVLAQRNVDEAVKGEALKTKNRIKSKQHS